MAYLIDTHAHLEDECYKDDGEEVIKRAEINGIKKIISVGINSRSSLYNIGLAKKHPGKIFASYGVHPHDAGEFSDKSLAEAEAAIKNGEISALGEIGLDYFKNLSPVDKQIKAFTAQLEFAIFHKIPVIMHLRDAFDDFKKIIGGKEFKGVFHCYSGDAAFAAWAAERGFHFSFTASITYPLKEIYKIVAKTNASVYNVLTGCENREKIPQPVKAIFDVIPEGRIMVETDCPYMSPQGLRGKRNEPANVRAVAECIAGITNTGFDAFCEKTTATAEKFFGI
ncbi:MAG TPA: TatD family hydrolase [Candidatus Wallbacteria bacterium]|nr:TatD family hydrolase [Candidatus Wallbacteria bacterium]